MSQGVWGLDFQRAEGFHGVGSCLRHWQTWQRRNGKSPESKELSRDCQLLAKQDSEHIYNNSLRYIFINGINQGIWVSR